MLDIVFSRVDDRLIHGQVVTGWLRHYQAKRIIIVDDVVSKDEFMLGILEMAAPPGIEVNAYSISKSIEVLLDENNSDTRVLILVKSPVAILELVNAGVDIKHLNVGGMGSNPERSKLYRNIQASQVEIDALKELDKKGVDVEFRVVVDHKPVTLKEVLSDL